MNELKKNTVLLLKKTNGFVVLLSLIILTFSFLAQKPQLETAIEDLENLEATFKPPNLPERTISRRGLSSLPNSMMGITGKFDGQWMHNQHIEAIRANELDPEFELKFEFAGERRLAKFQTYDPGTFYSTFQEMSTTYTLKSIKNYWNTLHSINSVDVLTEVRPYIVIYDKNRNQMVYHDIELLENTEPVPNSGHIVASQDYARAGAFTLLNVSNPNWIDLEYPDYKQFSSLREILLDMTHRPNFGSRFFLQGYLKPLGMRGYNFDAPGSTSFANPEEARKYKYSVPERAIGAQSYIPVTAETIAINPLETLLKEVPAENGWRHGDFRFNFKTLDELTKGYQDIEISKIKNILQRELERSVESVEIFGVNIPYSLVNRFGIILLMVTQAYFLLYFFQFMSSFSVDRAKIETPWVLFHKEGISKAVFVLTSAV